MKKIVLLVLCLIFVVVISGCAGTLSPEEIAKSSREVKAFLEEYPRAAIVASLVSNANIQEECDNAQLAVKDYWKIKIQDPDTNTTIISYIDNDSKNTVCIVKTGGTAKEEKPKANESEEEVKKEEPKEEDKNEVTPPEEVDLCKDVVCEDSTKTCPDKFEARCVNVCSKGVCSSCIPNCYGHEECIEDWSCSEWSKCLSDGKQTRTCSGTNNCGTDLEISKEFQSCEYVDTNCPKLTNFEFDLNYSHYSEMFNKNFTDDRLYFLGQFEVCLNSEADGVKIGDWKTEFMNPILYCDKERNETYTLGIRKGSKQGENINYYYLYMSIEKIEIDSSGNIIGKKSQYLRVVFDTEDKLIEQECLTTREYLEYMYKPTIV